MEPNREAAKREAHITPRSPPAAGASPIPASVLNLLSDVQSSAQIVSPNRASEWRVNRIYELQRPLSRSNVDRLAEEMRARRFIPGTQVYFCVTPDGRHYLVNGQHTLTALSEAAVPLVLTVTVYKVRDMAEVGKVYAHFDLQRVRNFAASWKAYKGGDVSPGETKALSGLPIIMGGFSVATAIRTWSQREPRMELMKEYVSRGIIDQLEAAFEGGLPKLVRGAQRTGIIAVALYTMLHQPSTASAFWNLVVTDSHPDRNHPTRLLARHLIAAKGGGSVFQQEDVNQAAAAWNHAWENKSVSYFKPGAWKEFRLLGTPWHRGKPTTPWC